jgi:hypothetical protein
MKRLFASVLFFLCLQSGLRADSALSKVVLVDGTETACEVLFEHPAVKVLVVRSAEQRTLQSLPMDQVHSVTTAGKTITYAARRQLTAAEQAERQLNGLWGDDAGPGQIGRYAKERFDRKPALIWARPGVTDSGLEAENWLDERGQRVTANPWKNAVFDGDVLLPPGDTPYNVLQPGKRDGAVGHRIRHLTIERNASYNIRYTVVGNLWVKDGATIGSGTQTGELGSRDTGKHTFVRFSGNRRPDAKGKVQDAEWAGISHWVRISMTDDATLEMIGKCGGAGDRTTLEKGTFIVSEDGHMGNGPRASYYGMPGSKTILLDGAGVGCKDRVLTSSRGTYGIGGTLWFGTPEQPLKRDLRFEGAVVASEDFDPEAKPGQRTTGASFVLGATGKMKVHSVDPTKARVIFCPRPEDAPYSPYALNRRDPKPMPTGVLAVFAGETDFNGVVFDGFYKGGIAVDEAARRQWKNVSFGTKNQGRPEELFRPLSATANNSTRN